jgi:hypothetical protein
MQRFDEILQPDGLFAIAIPLRSARWNVGDGYMRLQQRQVETIQSHFGAFWIASLRSQ